MDKYIYKHGAYVGEVVISVLCILRGTKDKKILQPPLALHLSFSYRGGCRLDKCRKKIRSLRLSGMEKLNRFSLTWSHGKFRGDNRPVYYKDQQCRK